MRDDIVLWYSTEVHAQVILPAPFPSKTWYAKSHGTVFIHRIFFPHDVEKNGMKVKVGSTSPLYWPVDKATILKANEWHRW